MKHSKGFVFKWIVFGIGLLSFSVAIVFDSLALAGISNNTYSTIRLVFSLLGLSSFIVFVYLARVKETK